jgi:tRNA wybutosine-synthesizing protein 1
VHRYTSGASNLTMKNVPYHADVKKFGESLCAARVAMAKGVGEAGAEGAAGEASSAGGTEEEEEEEEAIEEITGGTPASAEYGLACEHQHSCCILLARKDPYLVDGEWKTWIDYEKFQDLAASGKPFEAKEYMMPVGLDKLNAVHLSLKAPGFNP